MGSDTSSDISSLASELMGFELDPSPEPKTPKRRPKNTLVPTRRSERLIRKRMNQKEDSSNIKATSRVSPRVSPRSSPRDSPRDVSRDPPRDSPRGPSRDSPRDPPRDSPRGPSRESPRDSPRSSPRDSPRDVSRDSPRDPPRDPPRDSPRSSPRSSPRDSPRDVSRDSPRDLSRDSPRSSPCGAPRDQDIETSPVIEGCDQKNPIRLFANWFELVKASNTVYEPYTFCISTCGSTGQPTLGMVSLKGFDDNGFHFFTHYTSQKGRDIDQNPKVSMLFYWDSFNRQILIEGTAHKLSSEVADNYFKRRPQSSQIGAAISDQKSLIKSREALMDEYEKFEPDLGEQPPPRPETWGGYLVVPNRFEFWQGNTNRVHDRIIFRLKGDEEKVDGKSTKEAENGWVMEP